MNEKSLHLHRPLLDYIDYFEKLNKRSVPLIQKIVAPNVYFKDAFNETYDADSMERIFHHMFEVVDVPKFKVIDYGWGQRNTAYLRWEFTFKSRGNDHHIDGMSEVEFDEHSGKVVSHIDHWDTGPGIYEKIPLLGAVIRLIKTKMTADG